MTRPSRLQLLPERVLLRLDPPTRLRVGAVLTVLLLVCPGPVAGSSTPAPQFDRIDAPTGPPHRSINVILEDRDGFLWVGTHDGLARYDGYGFRIFRHQHGDSSSLSNSSVNVLVEDRSGRLWVGTDSGLNILRRDRWQFEEVDLLSASDSGSAVYSGLEDDHGEIWFATRQGLLRFDQQGAHVATYRHCPEDPHSLRYDHVRWLQKDPRGDLWVATVAPAPQRECTALQRHLEGSEFAQVTAVPRAVPALYYRFLIDSQNRFWLGNVGPLVPNPHGGDLIARGSHDFAGDNHSFCETRAGTVWVGSSLGLWSAPPNGEQPRSHTISSHPRAWLEDYVRCFFEDRAGILWMGTLGGLFKLDPHRKPFRHLGSDPDDPETMSAASVSGVAEGRDGSMWVSTFGGGGLNRLDVTDGSLRRITAAVPEDGDPYDSNLWAVSVDVRGTVWTAGNLLRSYDPVRRRFTVHADHPIFESGFWFILEHPEGLLWLGSDQGVCRFDIETGDLEGPFLPCIPPGSTRRKDFNSFAASKDAVWMGGCDVLVRWDLGSDGTTCVPLVTSSGSPVSSQGTWDLHVDATGIVWMGNSVGLLRFDPDTSELTAFTIRDGLPGSVVYSILEDDAGRLWLGTNQGLCRFDPAEAKGREFRSFSIADGLGNVEFNRDAAFKAENGTLFFGGMDGLTYFHPDQIRDNPYVPPVHITRIEVSNRDGVRDVNPQGLQALELNHRDSTFAFEFVALSYTDPGDNQYAYRLEGFDHAWVESGSRRYARYTSLPAGNYRFRVKGSNNDGLWNETGVTLPVVVLPAPWHTWWFRLLAALVVLSPAVVFGAYRLAKHREIERLRLRIAGDLHDDLSSNLSGIAVVADMLQQGEHVGEQEKEDLLTIRDGALKMVDGVRDIVWLIDPEHDTLDGLDSRMRSSASTLLRGFEVDFRGGLQDGSVRLPMAVRRNVFLIFKEALHNIVRHARASRVEVLLSANGFLRVSVIDDGRGFEVTGRPGGHGLGSMHRRAEEIGARLEVISAPGKGTAVTLRLDIPRFRDSLSRPRG